MTAAARARFTAVAAVTILWGAAMGAGQVATHRRLARRATREHTSAALGPGAAANFHTWGRRWAVPILAAGGFAIDGDDRSGIDWGRIGPVVFVGNHQTALDIPVSLAALPAPFAFMAKEQLREAPIIGAALAQSPSLFVDKRDARRAVQSLAEAAARIGAGTSVLLFAEGIRSFGGGMLPFERGAFALAVDAAVPVVPVTMRGVYRLLDERRRVSRPGRATVRTHPPVETRGLTRRDLPALLATVRETMRADLAEYEATHPLP